MDLMAKGARIFFLIPGKKTLPDQELDSTVGDGRWVKTVKM